MSNYSNIISYALSVTFGSEKAPLLAEICEATPNSVFAIERLLGIDEPPFMNDMPHPDCEKSYIDKEFVSYDIWKDRVHFKGMRNRAKEGDVPEFKESTSYCSLAMWNTGTW